jgi:quercetin dioxygenase-like cupin family protein
MIVKKLEEVPANPMPGCAGVLKRLVVGPQEGSGEIMLRHFTLEPGASSPHHAHPFPHVARIESGEGYVVDPEGREQAVRAGDFVYIPDNERHQFRNGGAAPFVFLCIVPRRGEA